MDIEINTDSLKADADRMKDQITKLRNSMDRMDSAILSLNTMWRGASNTAFNMQYRSDRENMKQVCDTVDKLIECMNKAAVQYNKCDESVKDTINSIKI